MIGINEAIADCIYNLLKSSNNNIDDLIKAINISASEMNNYLSCKKDLPLNKLCAISNFFNLGINEFLIKARILNNLDANIINPQDIINFKANFMSLWNKENLVS